MSQDFSLSYAVPRSQWTDAQKSVHAAFVAQIAPDERGIPMPAPFQPCPLCKTGELRWTIAGVVACAVCKRPVGCLAFALNQERS